MSATETAAPWAGKIYDTGWRASDGGVAAVKNPATGAALGEIGLANDADVARACAAASAAQPGWAALPFEQRAEVMRTAANLLKARAAEFCFWNTQECGSTGMKAQWEVQATYEQIQMAASLPMQPNGMMFPSGMPGRRNYWRRVPIGVVGVIAPWNFPMVLAIRSVAPALALGNAVVLKPDLQSAVTGGLLLARIFEDAGLPPGVLQVLPGGPTVGDALVRNPLVQMISFTGSTAVGRSIGAICGQLLKKTALELGGNNAVIVLPDADLDNAASCGAWGSFLHQGQICMQTGRHIVHRSIAGQYAEKLAARASRLNVGDPADASNHLGPLINDRQSARVGKIVAESVAAGAKIVVGGKQDGNFFAATVLTDVTPSMSVFTDELFGPVAPITVFDTDEEAIELVNRSEYGLAAAIHSANLGRARAIADRLHTGMIHINDQTVNNEFHVPFGGFGASGNSGRFGGPANIEEFTKSQWISETDTAIQYPF